jgi:hypothetical protein
MSQHKKKKLKKIPMPKKEKPRYKVSTSSLTPTQTAIVDTKMVPQVQPRVYYTGKVLAKMRYIVEKSVLEVGWMAILECPIPHVYLITDVHVPKQEVSSVETDISGEAMADLALELIEKDVDTSKMYGWFHSHVNMAVNPSAQDEEQVAEFLTSCPIFIRGIMNKRDDLKIDIYYRDEGVAYNAVRHEVVPEALTTEEIADLARTLEENVTEQRIMAPIVPYRQQNLTRPAYKPYNKWVSDEWDQYDGFIDFNESGYEERDKIDIDQCDTGFGVDWDENTPLTDRPSGWSLDQEYIALGKYFDTIAPIDNRSSLK